MKTTPPLDIPPEIHSLRLHIELKIPVLPSKLEFVKARFPNWFNKDGELLPEPKRHGSMKNFK